MGHTTDSSPEMKNEDSRRNAAVGELRPTASPPRPCVRTVVRRWTRVLLVLLVLLISAGFAGRWHSFLDVASSFQLQYFALAVILTAVLLLARSLRWSLLGGVCVLITGFFVVPWYVPQRTGPTAPGSATLRLALMNVLQSNDRFGDVCCEIEQFAPDVVVLQEVDEQWLAGVEPLGLSRPYHVYAPGDFVRGIAVLSRFPLADVHLESFGNATSPSVVCHIIVDGTAVLLVATQPWPPADADSFRSRNEQLRLVADHLATAADPRILVGDLNVTMWSPFYRALETRTRLRNTRQGFGVLPTFPMDRLPLLRVPIDHCLVSADIEVADCRLGKPSGSDHAPLFAELLVPRVSPEP